MNNKIVLLLLVMVCTYSFAQESSPISIVYNNDTLMVSPVNNNTSPIPWASGSSYTYATSESNGQENTVKIVDNRSAVNDINNAAKICSDLVYDNYDDWYLPSKSELKVLYNNKNILSMIGFQFYWSSTEVGDNLAACVDFINFGNDTNENKVNGNHVRCIRKATPPTTVVSAKAGSDQIICEGNSALLTASGGVQYIWSSGQALASISVKPVVNTTYTVTVTNGFGITASDDVIVNVQDKLQAGYSYYYINSNSISFISDTITGNFQMKWNFGDAVTSTNLNQVHDYVAKGTYEACLVISDTVCFSEVCNLITIGNLSCNAQFNYTVTNNSDTVLFTDQSILGITNSLWDFGDGTSSIVKRPIHRYAQNGMYTVKLIVFDSATSCMDKVEKIISVGNTNNKCKADFISTIDLNTNKVMYYSTSLGNNILAFVWDFGDGNKSQLSSTEHVYNASDNFQVCLNIVSNQCKDIQCKTIKTGADTSLISSEFNYIINPINLEVVFNNASQGLVNVYSWDFGDGTTSTSANPVHVYDTIGMYMVSLIVEDGNGQSSYQNYLLNVGANPGKLKGAFGVLMNKQVIAKGVIPLKFKGTVYSEESAVAWDFGDGTLVETTTLTPAHEYAQDGVYTVCMTVYNFDTYEEDTYCKEINVVTTDVGSDVNKSADEIRIYPNPVKTTLTIKGAVTSSSSDYSIGTYRDVSEIKIINTLGQLELITNQYSIDISTLKSGVYFIQIKTNNNILVKKFIKE